MTGIQSQTIVFKKSFLAQILLYQQQLIKIGYKNSIEKVIYWERLYLKCYIPYCLFTLVLSSI